MAYDTNRLMGLLDVFEDNELIAELKKRNKWWIYDQEMVDPDDYECDCPSIQDYENRELLDELEYRGFPEILKNIDNGQISLYDILKIEAASTILDHMNLDELQLIADRIEKARKYK